MLKNMLQYVQVKSGILPSSCVLSWVLRVSVCNSPPHASRCVKNTANVCALTAAAARAWRHRSPPPARPPRHGPPAATPQAHRWAYLPAHPDATAQRTLRWGQSTPWGLFGLLLITFNFHLDFQSHWRQILTRPTKKKKTLLMWICDSVRILYTRGFQSEGWASPRGGFKGRLSAWMWKNISLIMTLVVIKGSNTE